VTLLELRDALAKATGPDMALDAYLQAAIFPDWVARMFRYYDDYDERPFSVKIANLNSSGPSLHGLAENHLVPGYTRSIDASVTLEEPADEVTVLRCRDRCLVTWHIKNGLNPSWIKTVEAATEPNARALARVEYELQKAGKP
jgi:hypothetical protein